MDGFFKGIMDPANTARTSLNQRLTAYQRKVAEAQRRAREEAERKAREEAERLAREAEAKASVAETDTQLDDAITSEHTAKQAAADAARAAKQATANAAELSRSRNPEGVVASLRTFWDYKDLDRASLDLEALRPHLPMDALEKAVRAFIRAGGRELAGVTIFENTTSQVR